MKSLEREGFITAHEIAVRKGHTNLVPILEPKLYHIISSDSLEKLEKKVHTLMQSLVGDKVSTITIPLYNFSRKYLTHPLSVDYKARYPSPSVISHDGDGHSESFPMGSNPYHVWSEFPLPLSLSPPPLKKHPVITPR